MSENCPKCGAAFRTNACTSAAYETFACESAGWLNGQFHQSDKCRIAELMQKCERLAKDKAAARLAGWAEAMKASRPLLRELVMFRPVQGGERIEVETEVDRLIAALTPPEGK